MDLVSELFIQGALTSIVYGLHIETSFQQNSSGSFVCCKRCSL